MSGLEVEAPSTARPRPAVPAPGRPGLHVKVAYTAAAAMITTLISKLTCQAEKPPADEPVYLGLGHLAVVRPKTLAASGGTVRPRTAGVWKPRGGDVAAPNCDGPGISGV